MKRSSECELSFQDLNEIPRSSRQKQQTFQKIMLEKRRETETKRLLLPKILTGIVSLAACFLFVFIIFTETNLNSGANLKTSIEGKEIVQMGLAFSKSETSFIPVKEERQKNIYIINDDNWSKMVFDMIKNAEKSTIKPVFDPSYDLMLTLEGPEILKIKVWEEEGDLYIKELSEDEYYYVSKEKSEVFFKYVNSLHHNIEKPK
ncbi:hypothetical protein [Cytobacillus dafuensis]|uniref:Uncharacterized protein n=1 Tax=Cytobacillus dafuensis TaxID=1742359 RepID=A0A5B8Z2K7_CYTDA|nr:hypothetical protein [Cytobacillus dafuensis]QED47300.1 hypothetical protein FSZ17_08610 [Cytobacillus dafuensis]